MLDLHRESETSKADLAAGLTYLMEAQLPTLKAAGQDHVGKEILRQYGMALQIEVSEFLNELPWKEWKTYKEGANIEAISGELVDVLHFLGTFTALLRHYGITPEMLADAFAEKSALNRRRFAGEVEGYGWAGSEMGPEGDPYGAHRNLVAEEGGLK